MPDFKTENALVLSSRPLGERSHIITLFTRERGRHLGVINTRKSVGIGTLVQARWQARLSEQMGRFYLEEGLNIGALFLDDARRLACLASLCALLDKVLPERQAFEGLYQEVCAFLIHLESDDFLQRYVLLEVMLLEALGFGLDMSCCAGGGDRQHLAYISPKTGRAVSREKGLPYHDRLLPLPAFLWQEKATADTADIRAGLRLTGYFLSTHALGRELPKMRDYFVSLLADDDFSGKTT